jgi:hypothetical protein
MHGRRSKPHLVALAELRHVAKVHVRDAAIGQRKDVACGARMDHGPFTDRVTSRPSLTASRTLTNAPPTAAATLPHAAAGSLVAGAQRCVQRVPCRQRAAPGCGSPWKRPNSSSCLSPDTTPVRMKACGQAAGRRDQVQEDLSCSVLPCSFANQHTRAHSRLASQDAGVAGGWQTPLPTRPIRPQPTCRSSPDALMASTSVQRRPSIHSITST